MKIRDKIIIFSVIGVLSLFSIALPYWIYITNGNTSVKSEDLTTFSGSIENIEKTTTTGRHRNPVIYLKLLEYPYEFRIANSSYHALNKDSVMNIIKRGTKVSIETKTREIKRSQSGSSLNSVLKWRGQPQVYSLKTDNISLLTVEQYNNQEESLNKKKYKMGCSLSPSYYRATNLGAFLRMTFIRATKVPS